jgi:hypothetical protein
MSFISFPVILFPFMSYNYYVISAHIIVSLDLSYQLSIKSVKKGGGSVGG